VCTDTKLRKSQEAAVSTGEIMKIRHSLARTGAVLGAFTLLAACGNSSDDSAGSSAPPTTSSASTSSSSPAAKGTAVTVKETEYKLQLSQSTFTPGTYTFTAENDGGTTHALEIEGPGIEEQQTGSLSPGASGSLTVTLQSGKYELYCPVDGHRELGMEMDITVS
jgi:plastocyanin